MNGKLPWYMNDRTVRLILGGYFAVLAAGFVVVALIGRAP